MIFQQLDLENVHYKYYLPSILSHFLDLLKIYFSTNIKAGIAPIVRAIEDENVTAELVYAPKILGVYGRPSLMRYNKLVYNQELRDKLWSYTANELNLDI